MVTSLETDGGVYCLAWSPDGTILAAATERGSVMLFSTSRWQLTGVLEGHTGPVSEVAFSGDGQFLASLGGEGQVRLWNVAQGSLALVIPSAAEIDLFSGLAFHPTRLRLATVGERRSEVRIWDVDPVAAREGRLVDPTVYYSNAKAVLVGDSGVGKSGLALVLTGQKFVATESTHARHVMLFQRDEVQAGLGAKHIREVFLWDLAGQPGYRVIHQLSLNEVSVALVVFDSSRETDPFGGVRYWDRALRQAQRVQVQSKLQMKKLLVAARLDRQGISASPARVRTFLKELQFSGYFLTSAKDGSGIADLRRAILGAVDWENTPRVSSPEIFQEIRDFLTSESASGRVLGRLHETYRGFVGSSSDRQGRDIRAEFEVCIGRLESRGVLRRLTFGDLLLLQPELLDAYASALVNAARAEPDGMGFIREEDAKQGNFRIPKDERLANRDDESLLLIATVEDLLRHELAFREPAEDGVYLVFPSQFTREHPDMPDPPGRTIVFRFDGAIQAIYSTLAVRLAHSGLFVIGEMWKNAATYVATVGGTCGIYLHETGEGQAEMVLFFGEEASEETRFQFEEYVVAHLRRRSLPETIIRERIFQCPDCNTAITELQATRRRGKGFDWIDCNVCGGIRISLKDREERLPARAPSVVSDIDRTADSRRELDASLVSATAEMRTKGFRDWAGGTRVTVALVFTDIVGYTQLANELGNEQINKIRNKHFAKARKLIKKFDGYEVKTIGDAFMVAFRTAVDALNFAIDLQKDTGHERVRIRAGINVGLAHIEGEDAFGAMVNYTSRVEAAAEGPRIALSDRAKQDITEEGTRPHRRLVWEELPPRELKGFQGFHRIWLLRSDQAPTPST